MIEISVTDNGIGIQEQDKSKLFKLFGFLETSQELNTKGIGLGLHICKMVVKKLGGDIDCDSVWLEGATFTFLIALNETKNEELKA